MNEIERQAPELRVQKWIGKDGESIAPFKLSDIGPGPKILFAFQHWCQGCHLHGFPTLQKLHAALSSKDVGFAVIQTVFEGADENTFEKLRVKPGDRLLDIGCGWGPIALSLALLSPEATVWAVDVTERALDLTRRNAATLGLTNVRTARPDEVPADLAFAAIWSNPPIRIGKPAVQELLGTWLPRLTQGADAHLVIGKNLGADGYARWITDELGPRMPVE